MNSMIPSMNLDGSAKYVSIAGSVLFLFIGGPGIWFAHEGVFGLTLFCGVIGLLILFGLFWPVRYLYEFSRWPLHYVVLVVAGGYLGALLLLYLTGG